MGYTHYYKTPKRFAKAEFVKFSEDVKKILAYCNDELGISIGDAYGEEKPEIDSNIVSFNGSVRQPAGMWTTKEQISIPWPSSTASLLDIPTDPIADKTAGSTLFGDLVNQRVAPAYEDNPNFADGSYETFYIERVQKHGSGFCKTAYRPYDLAVTASLIALKHYFPECIIKTDGKEKDWLDAKILCNNVLGYGLDFEI